MLQTAKIKNSATGTRTRVARVRAEYPSQLDYSGSDNLVNQFIYGVQVQQHNSFARRGKPSRALRCPQDMGVVFLQRAAASNKEQASMPFQADTREAEPSGFLCVSLPACLSLVFSLPLSLPASLSLFACLVQARTYTPNHNPDQPWARMATGQPAKPTNQPQTEAVLVWSSGAPER